MADLRRGGNDLSPYRRGLPFFGICDTGITKMPRGTKGGSYFKNVAIMTKPNYLRFGVFSLVLLALVCCRSSDRKAAAGRVPTGKADIRYAHSFSIEYYDHYK